jgi:uncharacterized membrane protein YkvA (DUF1232 family)
MATATEQLGTLQGFIDSVQEDASTVLTSIDGADVPPSAKRVLIGALSYGLDLLDIFPDHYEGLGLADDAAVLRLAARHAVQEGAGNAELRRLAQQAAAVDDIFGELAEALDRFVAKLPERAVRNRTADQILGSKDLRAGFDGDVKRAVAKLKPAPIPVGVGGPEAAMRELLRMTQSSLKKAGLLG